VHGYAKTQWNFRIRELEKVGIIPMELSIAAARVLENCISGKIKLAFSHDLLYPSLGRREVTELYCSSFLGLHTLSRIIIECGVNVNAQAEYSAMRYRRLRWGATR
jgi:hypothetical protein